MTHVRNSPTKPETLALGATREFRRWLRILPYTAFALLVVVALGSCRGCADDLVDAVGGESPAEPNRSPATNEHVPMIVMTVEDGWDADVHDVSAVLTSTATAFLEHAPSRILHSIAARPCAGTNDFERGITEGECAQAPFSRWDGYRFVIVLSARGHYWDWYAYQFAHELCHVLTRSAALRGWSDDQAMAMRHHERPNRWFEEALCEVASLYTLRRMSELWKHDGPILSMGAPPARTPAYAPALWDYAEKRLNDPARDLPSGMTLADWYRAHADSLRDVAFDRPKESVVAKALLPDFEADPRGWNAISYLSLGDPSEWNDLETLFSMWHGRVPPDERRFVTTLAKHFGYTLE